MKKADNQLLVIFGASGELPSDLDIFRPILSRTIPVK